MQRIIKITDIDLHRSPMPRAMIHADVSNDYREKYEAKKKMPPLIVFSENGKPPYLLADGRHRLVALEALMRTDCFVDVHNGDYTACLHFAVIANAMHGLRRSNDDKRQCVKLVLKNSPNMSHREIAELCGVSHTFVDSTISALPNKVVATVASPSLKSPCEIKAEAPAGTSKNILTFTTGTNPANNNPPAQKPVPIWLDKIGYQIPESIRHYVTEATQIRQMQERIHAIQRDLKAKLNELLWRGADFQKADEYLGYASDFLKGALPDVVCTQCQGRGDKIGCTVCKGKGFIAFFRLVQ